MSDISSAAIATTRRDWKAEHLATYLESGGSEGHIVDVSDIGGHLFTTTLLLKYIGRKSGRTLITPLIYGDYGGAVVIVASKGGADEHPAWYLNVLESETLEFQIATQAFSATWRVPEGAEHDEIWAFMERVFPPYRDYQASTDRTIPLVLLTPAGRVAVFTPDDPDQGAGGSEDAGHAGGASH